MNRRCDYPATNQESAFARVIAETPETIAAWRAIVATGLVIGSLPLLLGLVVMFPILGHAT